MAEKRKGKRTGPSKRRVESVRRVSRHLEGVKSIDARNYELLGRFLTDHGKIIPGRLTGASAKQQRQIKRAIRRARVMGVLP
jgi:small subunit ribosomal protein S18